MNIEKMSKQLVTSSLAEVLNRREGGLNESIKLRRNVIDDPLDVITLSIFQETIRDAVKNKQKTIEYGMLFKGDPKQLNSLIFRNFGFKFDAEGYFRDDETISLRNLEQLIDGLFNHYAQHIKDEIIRERDKIAKWFR